MLHCRKNVRTGQLIPRSQNHGRSGIVLFHKSQCLFQLFLVCHIGMRENDAGRIFHLIVEEFTEILHIHLCLGSIHNRCEGVQLCTYHTRFLHGRDHIRKLAHSGRLDQHSVGMIGFDHLMQSFCKIAHQRTADTARIQLVHGDARILHEGSVHADLAELVFHQHQLFAAIGFLDQFFYERGLSCAQKARKNIYFGHIIRPFRIPESDSPFRFEV